MNIGLNTLYDIGSKYTIQLNEEEVLVFEDDNPQKSETPQEKVIKEEEEKKTKEASEQQASNELSPDEKRLVTDLQARDAEVKTHEAAHQAAGGGMTGAASYTYQQGPDGKMYAIGGEVSISTPAASSPEEAIANARQVVASAMAAGNPSPQDHAVAASARVMEIKAQQQLARQQQEEISGMNTYSNQALKPNEEDKNTLVQIDLSA